MEDAAFIEELKGARFVDPTSDASDFFIIHNRGNALSRKRVEGRPGVDEVFRATTKDASIVGCLGRGDYFGGYLVEP